MALTVKSLDLPTKLPHTSKLTIQLILWSLISSWMMWRYSSSRCNSFVIISTNSNPALRIVSVALHFWIKLYNRTEQYYDTRNIAKPINLKYHCQLDIKLQWFNIKHVQNWCEKIFFFHLRFKQSSMLNWQISRPVKVCTHEMSGSRGWLWKWLFCSLLQTTMPIWGKIFKSTSDYLKTI